MKGTRNGVISHWRNRGAAPELPAGPVLRRLADVPPETVRWLWPERVPLGKLTLLAGDPGLGKSFVSLDLAARVSAGLPWPDGAGENPAGGVVILSCQDDVADTIRPRLDACGADCARINLLEGVRRTEGEHVGSVNLDDVPTIEAAIEQTPECRLVIVDPVSAYLGRADGHRNDEVRALLNPIAALAARHRVAVIMVGHLNKGGGGTKALYRAMGSLAFMAAVRAGWLVARDEEDRDRRLMLACKSNLGPEQDGLAYRITGSPARVAWDAEPISVTADEALSGGPTPGTRIADAIAWLKNRLEGAGPVPTNTVNQEARRAGYSQRTIERARDELGIVSRPPAFGQPWVMELPPFKGAASPVHSFSEGR